MGIYINFFTVKYKKELTLFSYKPFYPLPYLLKRFSSEQCECEVLHRTRHPCFCVLLEQIQALLLGISVSLPSQGQRGMVKSTKQTKAYLVKHHSYRKLCYLNITVLYHYLLSSLLLKLFHPEKFMNWNIGYSSNGQHKNQHSK